MQTRRGKYNYLDIIPFILSCYTIMILLYCRKGKCYKINEMNEHIYKCIARMMIMLRATEHSICIQDRMKYYERVSVDECLQI